MKTSDVFFWSGSNERLSGTIYEPERDNGIGIVFCHGFGGARTGTPPGLAKLMAERGYAVLTFDYRGFGDSEGGRGRLLPVEQIEDAVQALEYFAAQTVLPRKRLAIYGTSFGGGIAICAARRSKLASAAAVTVPVTSGSRWLASIMRYYEFLDLQQRSSQALAKKALTGEIEMVDRFDIMIPDPLSRVLYKEPFPLALETFFHVINHEPVADAKHLTIPVSVIGVNGDPLVPVAQAVDLHEQLAGPKNLELFEGNDHYVVYGDLLQRTAESVLGWFDRHLCTASAR